MRLAPLIVCIAILASCAVPKAALPVALTNHATVVSQGIGTNANVSSSWCRAGDDQVVLALTDDKTSVRIISVNAAGAVGWQTELPYPNERSVPVLGMHAGNVAVSWTWSDDDTDSTVVQTNLLRADNGSAIDTGKHRSFNEDATVALYHSPFQNGSILLSVLEGDTTINGDSHDMATVTVCHGSDMQVARSCSLVLAGDLASWNAVFDPAGKTYYACVLRDSLVTGGDTPEAMILEVYALSEGGVSRHATQVKSTVPGADIERVIISTGINDGTPVAWLEFQAEDDGDVRQVMEIELSNPTLAATFHHVFTTEEMQRITGDEDLDDVILRDMVATSAGRIMVLERINFIVTRYYYPDMHVWHNAMPMGSPMSIRPPTSFFHSSIHSTTLDNLQGHFKTYEFYVVCIDENNRIRWTAPLNRDHTDPDESSEIATSYPAGYRFYLGAEQKGRLPLVYRNVNGSSMVTTSINLSDGTVETPKAVLSLDKAAMLYGAYWSGPNTMHFFMPYGKDFTTAQVTIRME